MAREMTDQELDAIGDAVLAAAPGPGIFVVLYQRKSPDGRGMPLEIVSNCPYPAITGAVCNWGAMVVTGKENQENLDKMILDAVKISLPAEGGVQ